MITVLGAVLFSIAAFLWGHERGKTEETKLRLLEGIISFVAYTEEQITNFKTPLVRIYSDFSDAELEKWGFTDALREKGAEGAVAVLRGRIPDQAYKDAELFAKGLGGGYSEGQKKLCDVTVARLEKTAKELREAMPERVRMYRLLPVLIAASVIILLI